MALNAHFDIFSQKSSCFTIRKKESICLSLIYKKNLSKFQTIIIQTVLGSVSENEKFKYESRLKLT